MLEIGVRLFREKNAEQILPYLQFWCTNLSTVLVIIAELEQFLISIF